MKKRIHCVGDHINTDQIIASRYLTQFLSDQELGKYVLETVDPLFASKVRQGDVLVAGVNFGCGSSREEAVSSLAACGFSYILADSFARTFFRNCINRGAIRIIECPGIREACIGKNEIEIDLKNHQLIIEGKEPIPIKKQADFIETIIRAGGLLNYISAQKNSGGDGNACN